MNGAVSRPARVGLGLALLLALWGASAAQAATLGGPTYTVRPGDTAYSVARQAGTDVATLLWLNDLSAPDLRAGQVLRLPGGPGLPAVAPGPVVAPRSHTVEAGQTLYSVARLYGLKAAALQDFNHLAAPDLKPGQVLLLPGPATLPDVAAGPVPGETTSGPPLVSRPPAPARSAPQPVAAVSPVAELPAPRHTVQPGQTLYAIARLYGLRPADLLALNHLSTPDLRPGQLLLLPVGVTVQSAVVAAAVPTGASPASAVPDGAVFSPGVPLPPPPASPRRSDLNPGARAGDVQAEDGPPEDRPTGDWRRVAVSLLGVPYVYGGSSRSGTDCSGLVLQVFGGLGLSLPRQSALQARTGMFVEQTDLQAGDLLFFDTEGRGQVTHVGIYLGDYQGLTGAFINANSFGGQVAINQLSEKYFAQRYLWARRVLGVLAQGH